jgi:hypothetical protein
MWREDEHGTLVRRSLPIFSDRLKEAPPEVRDFVAVRFTDQDIEDAKRRWAEKVARQQEVAPPSPVLSPVAELSVKVDAVVEEVAALKLLPTSPPVVAERVAAAEQRADANMLSMAQMVMDTKNENTLAVNGLQAQINGLNKELADLRSKVN